MNRASDYLELFETKLKAAGEEYARQIHEGVAQDMTDGMEEAVRECYGYDDSDLILAALRCRVYESLEGIVHEAALGWHDVFFQTLRDRYEGRAA